MKKEISKTKNNGILVIVAGAAGEIGTEFCKAIIRNDIDCIGIIRNKRTNIESSFYKEITCELSNEEQIEKVFFNVDFGKYKKIIFLHTIGVDMFDPRGYPPRVNPMNTIPPEVYNTNVNSFKYLLRYCVNKIKKNNSKKIKTKFRIAIIAGVGDKHAPFVIESFCEAKFILRQYIQSFINLYPNWISGLSINVSSTITKSALAVRPYANTHYWLEPKEVVNKSFKDLISFSSQYEEIDIVKKSPKFFNGYYENNKILYEKWSKETGIEGIVKK